MRACRTCASLLAILVLAACDKSGVHPLGRVRDNLGPCTSQTETWLRSTETGTEIFLIGAPGADDAGLPTPGCFARGFVTHDSSTHLEFGTYLDDGTGTNGTFTYAAEYDFKYQPEESLLARQGSIRIDRTPPLVVPITRSADGASLVLSYADEPRRLTSMSDLIDALDITTQEGAVEVFRLFNLPFFTSQARILGFGSSGMTQYLGQTATFVGAIENALTVSLDEILNPVTDITYIDFMDLTGITHDGLIHSEVTLSGDGTMSGVVRFRMESETRTILGATDYEDLLIYNGVAGGGSYTLSIEDGGDYEISYTYASDIDLRGVLPVSTP